MSGRTALRIAGESPWKRGYERGRRARDGIARAWRVYATLFETVAARSGRTLDLPAIAGRTAQAARAWAPEPVEEMEGAAEGAGVPFWTIAALNARTEILAEAGATRAGECSTLVRTGVRTTGGQCWDWHEELAHAWHIQTVSGGTRNFAGVTEYGILAKIGVNDAGVGVLFNILGHQDDAATGVPVHLVARHVLGTAGSFDEAVGILAGAPVSASTVMTVVTADRAASVETSPAGSAVIAPDDGEWLVRTNHFLAPALAAGELRGRREPETYDRHRLLTARVRGRPGPLGRDDSPDCSPPTAATAPRCAATPRREERWAPAGRRWPPSRWTRQSGGSWCTRAVPARRGRRPGHRSPRRCPEPADTGSSRSAVPPRSARQCVPAVTRPVGSGGTRGAARRISCGSPSRPLPHHRASERGRRGRTGTPSPRRPQVLTTPSGTDCPTRARVSSMRRRRAEASYACSCARASVNWSK